MPQLQLVLNTDERKGMAAALHCLACLGGRPVAYTLLKQYHSRTCIWLATLNSKCTLIWGGS